MPKPGAKPKTKPGDATASGGDLYPELKVVIRQGDNALTAKEFKEIIGWTVEDGTNKFGDDYVLKDMNGEKVRLTRNHGNRNFNEPWAITLAQDQLNKRWALNGETIVIGKKGNVLSGQHRGVGLILAEQESQGKNAEHWREKWGDKPVSMECIIVYGVDESPTVTRTLDNVRPRTLGDVLFSDPTMFGREPAKERNKLVKMVDNAVRTLWHRMGADLGAFSPRRTHSEALDFIQRHPHVLRAVKHIHQEDKEQKASRELLGPGTNAAFLYLMGCSNGEGERYHAARMEGNANEKKLDWSMWDKACEFWTAVIKEFSGATSPGVKSGMEGVRLAKAKLLDEETGPGYVTRSDMTSILINAWKRFILGLDVTCEACELNVVDDGGIKKVRHTPLEIGGPDLPPPAEEPKDDKDDDKGPTEPTQEDRDMVEPGEEHDPSADAGADAGQPIPNQEDGPQGDDPSPEEILTEKERVRAERKAKLEANMKTKQEAARKARERAGMAPAAE